MKRLSIRELMAKFRESLPFDDSDRDVLKQEYLDNPGELICPVCGDWEEPENSTIEVVAFVDTHIYRRYDKIQRVSPDSIYTVLIICRGDRCGRSTSIDIDEDTDF